MTEFTPSNPNYEADARSVFERQAAMKTLDMALVQVRPGEVIADMPYRADLTQQGGFMHAGVITTMVDTACGCAAYTLMPPGVDVLTVEYKINLMSPAVGERFRAIGRVLKPGRTITVCMGEVFALRGGDEKLIAMMQATLIQVKPQTGEQA